MTDRDNAGAARDAAPHELPTGLLPQGSQTSSTTGAEALGWSAEESASPHRASFLALFSAVMLPMFMSAVDQTLLATATPRIAAELGGLADTSWIAVGYLLAATVMAPLYGRLGDRFGRRPVMMVALVVFIVGSLACAAAPGMGQLIVSRVLQGLGGGGLMVLSHALIGELVPPWERPRYQAYFAAVFTSSSVGGPLIGGFVVHHGNWRWLFLANLPLGLLALWRVWRLPKAPVPTERGPFDPLGFVLFALCAASALVWFGQVGHRFALWSGPSALFGGAAIVTGFALARQQRAHPHAFLPLDVLRLPGVGWLCLSVAGFAATLFALLFLLPIYVQVARHTDALDAGLQLLPLTAGVVAGGAVNGRYCAWTGTSGRLPPWGLGAAAVGVLALALLPPVPWMTGTAAAVCGLGLGMVMPNAQLASQIIAGRRRLGAAAALVALTRSMGASVGTAAFGGLAFLLLQGAQGGGPLQVQGLDPERATSAFRFVFVALSLFAAATIVAAAKAPRIDLRRAQDGAGAS